MNLNTRNFYKEFIEDEKQFYLHEAGFDDREERLFRLRVYDGKTLEEAAEIMDYGLRTVERINQKMKKKILKAAPMYFRGASSKYN